MKTLFRAVAVLALLSSSLFAQRITGTGSITSSGGQLTFANPVGGMTVSVEELISGSPATVSVVIQGCKNGLTCTTLDTYTTVANAIRNAAPTTVYDYFTVSASWTGGSNVSVTVNFTATIARNGTGGGGAASYVTYSATANGLKCDGSTDDTAALNTLQATIVAGGGGTLIFPTQTCKFSSSEITIPNNNDTWTDGSGTISSQAPIRWTCAASDVQYQQLMSAGATLSQIQNACVLDFEFNATDAKLVGLGMGHFEADHLAFVDQSTDCAAFMLFTNTMPDIHDNAFIGSTKSVTSGPYSCNDAVVLGSAGATQASKTLPAWFQGYAGARVDHNFFNQVKRAVLLNSAANTIIVDHNTIWSQAGCSTCGPFEIAGAGDYGNSFSYNNIETVHYLYGLNISNNASNTLVVGQVCSDTSEFSTECIHTSGTDVGTLILGGFAPAGKIFSSSNTSFNAWVLNAGGTNWSTTLHLNGFINLSERNDAPPGTAATEALLASALTKRPQFTKWNQSTQFDFVGLQEIPTTQTSTATDNFTRTNAATLGTNWTAISTRTSLQILSNNTATQATGAYEGDFYSNISFPADQWSSCTLGVTVSNSNNFVGCAVRVASAADQWYAILMTTNGATFCGIRKMSAGTITTLQNCSGAGYSSTNLPVVGDVLTITAVGSTLAAYKNGILLATVTDSSYATGSPGIVGFATSAAADIKYTGWAGGYMNCQSGVVVGLVLNSQATCAPQPAVAGLQMSPNANTGPLLISATAPSISTHFNTSGDSITSNGTASLVITVGTGTGTSTGVISLPTATTGWNCWLTNQNRADHIQQTASSVSSATFTNFGTTFSATNWTASDVLRGGCFAY